MQKRWIIKPAPEKEAINALANSLGGPQHSLMATLLLLRGVNNFQEAKDFFVPTLANLHNPFLMADMDKAVNRLQLAMEKQEKILIFGDYDVDGTTSVSLVYHFLKHFYPNLDYYVPDRYTEGYGISDSSIEFAYRADITLIIALDCGVKSVEKVAHAKTLGIDYLICDHHLPGTVLPDAAAVLDAKRPDCHYPYKELSGCGVGFKLMQAWCLQSGKDLDLLYQYLDLLCISIAADIVPITGENRIFCAKGIDLVNFNPRPGVEALLQVAGFQATLEVPADSSPENFKLPNRKRNLNITNIVFGLAPRINAAGRMVHAKAAVDLLVTDDPDSAFDIAQGINQNNSDRKEADASYTKAALEMIAQTYPETRSTVLFNPEWSKGVIGIVASRCIEHYFRPTIILTESNGKYNRPNHSSLFPNSKSTFFTTLYPPL